MQPRTGQQHAGIVGLQPGCVISIAQSLRDLALLATRVRAGQQRRDGVERQRPVEVANCGVVPAAISVDPAAYQQRCAIIRAQRQRPIEVG
ncbi:MAG: hypothetical protein U0Z44_14695 [Kouleothrix sp.]